MTPRATRLVRGDAAHRAALQDLLERCADYMELDEGAPPGPGAADELIEELPPGREHRDKWIHLWSVEPGAPAVAVTDLVCGYPADAELFLGLLALDPAWRGRGLGAAILAAVEEMAAGGGGHTLWLAVLERNPRAQRFWSREGFEVVDRVVRRGRPDPVVRMRKHLG